LLKFYLIKIHIAKLKKPALVPKFKQGNAFLKPFVYIEGHKSLLTGKLLTN